MTKFHRKSLCVMRQGWTWTPRERCIKTRPEVSSCCWAPGNGGKRAFAKAETIWLEMGCSSLQIPPSSPPCACSAFVIVYRIRDMFEGIALTIKHLSFKRARRPDKASNPVTLCLKLHLTAVLRVVAPLRPQAPFCMVSSWFLGFFSASSRQQHCPHCSPSMRQFTPPWCSTILALTRESLRKIFHTPSALCINHIIRNFAFNCLITCNQAGFPL